MKLHIAATLVLILIAIVILPQSFAGTVRLPQFSLKDPYGNLHDSKRMKRKPLVLIYTAPTLNNESIQKKWCDYLVQTKPGRAGFVMIEDMSVALFRGMASDAMKKEWRPSDQPLLLLDEEGALRAAFGAPRNATCVYVYDRGGRLVHSEDGRPSLDSAKAIWSKAR